MTPTNTYTEALQALAQHVTQASERVNQLRNQEAFEGGVSRLTRFQAEQAEDYARHAFALATGERIGTPQYTALLAQHAAEAAQEVA